MCKYLDGKTTSELVRMATAPKISTKFRIEIQEEIARREVSEINVKQKVKQSLAGQGITK